jgi:acetylornithine deacetylase/succinyl-diaminopimelate desuccinylase-like protein
MVRINSEYERKVVHNHEEIAQFLAEEFKKLGLETELVRPEEEDFPAVVGRLRGSEGKPVLGMTQLYNTVYIGDRSKWTVDPLGGEVKDGKVWGRGAANSKGSLAAMMEAARVLKESGAPLKGDVILLFIPGEGGTEFCLPWIVENRPEVIRADWYLAGGGGGNIVKRAGGHTWLKVIVRGHMAHPGATVEQGRAPVNAIHKMAKIIPAIIDVDSWMTWEPDPLFANYVSSRGKGKPFVEVNKLVGGYEINMVPDFAEADIDIRLFPNQDPEKVEAELEALFAKMKEEDPDLHVEIERIGTQKVADHYWDLLTEDDPLIAAIFEIGPKYTGEKPKWRMSAGGGRPDIWNLGAKWVSFGVSKGGNSHAPDEWVDIEAMAQQAKLYSELALRVLQ